MLNRTRWNKPGDCK